MKRRAFLLGSVGMLGSLSAPALAQPMGFYNRVTCVVVTDVTPEVSIAHLLSVFDAFAERGLPFTCVVNPFDKEGNLIQSSHSLATLLSGYALQGYGMEFAPHIPDLSEKSEYFQARSVRDLNEDLRSILAPPRDDLAHRSALKIVACDEITDPKPPTGVRSAGVSTVLVLPKEDAPVSSEAWSNGTVRIYGGQQIDLSRFRREELDQDDDATQAFYYVSAADFEGLSVADVKALATTFADQLLATESTGRNTVQLVSDLQFRDDYDFERYVAVHLVKPGPKDVAAREIFEAFRAELNDVGIVASIGDDLRDHDTHKSAQYWLPVEQTRAPDFDGNPSVELQNIITDCRDGTVSLKSNPHKALLPGHSLAFGLAKDVTPGFDKCAVLRLPCLDVNNPQTASRVSTLVGQTNDIVLSIRVSALTKAFARKSLINELLRIASDGVSRLVPVQLLGQALAPQGAEIERQRRTIAMLPETRPRRSRRKNRERQALLEDAKLAWSYIERNTVPHTGLCSATVDYAVSNGSIHPTVTMWDVGSHINGLIAARQLGLLPKKKFDQNIALILRQIRGRRSQGRNLPQGWIRTDREKWGNKNFDGSDAGRLLSSLDNLRQFANLNDRLDDLVGSWSLSEIVIDGKVHSVTDGKLHSAYRSHSAHYSARAFRQWGIDVDSPYEVFKGRSVYDDQMALLEAVSWIGPIGAEPLLLEYLELGMSPESAHLAEVLFAAQLEDHKETGRLIAVSEGPIDRMPWFTYQGLQLDALERTWALDTVGHEPQYNTPEFWRDNLVISSKAAFLWSCYKPSEYSDTLLTYVREKARTKFGFASSIFNKTGRATSNYSDLNTNAIILQSIANALSEA